MITANEAATEIMNRRFGPRLPRATAASTATVMISGKTGASIAVAHGTITLEPKPSTVFPVQWTAMGSGRSPHQDNCSPTATTVTSKGNPAPSQIAGLLCLCTSFIRSVIAQLEHLSRGIPTTPRSEEHTSELQSRENLVCRLLLEKKQVDLVVGVAARCVL